MPLRVVGASNINRMRPVDMTLGSGMLERVLGMPLADAIPFALSRLGVVCCYAFPHVAFVLFQNLCAGTRTMGFENVGWAWVGVFFFMYAVVINAVGEYIANLWSESTFGQTDFSSQVVGAGNAIALTFGALLSRATAFLLVFIVPFGVFAPSSFGFFLSAGLVYLSFTVGLGGYLSATLFPDVEEKK
jgi:hypothetical protein